MLGCAPPGWDEDYHATPRKQLAIILNGEGTICASDGDNIKFGPGNINLLSDRNSKGHLTRIEGDHDAAILFVGLAEE